ncbi:MAG: leucine dehydrogenase [Planctomycetes bacterium]|nr:leucine dehydrogenase [Planctomycetota bacterium]
MLEITEIPVEGYEKVCRAVDPDCGFHAIIAVHSTVLGPALGGMRLWNYGSEDDALFDVKRLARGMTYKASCAGLDLGGGKSVLLGNPSDKSSAWFQCMGEFVHSFGGSYITAEDVNTKPEDMAVVHTKTDYVVGLAGRSGNPSPKTAWGCYLGLKAAAEEKFGTADLNGLTVAIEGAGSVGTVYGELIAKEGGKIVAADIYEESAQRLADLTGGTVVGPDQIHGVECDVYAPCALGGSVNDQTIPQLKAKVVCGAANNQLLEDHHGTQLLERGILYAPDYVVNAGGLINVYNELVPGGYDEDRSMAQMGKIRENLREIFALAREEGICPSVAADRFGDQRVVAALAAK